MSKEMKEAYEETQQEPLYEKAPTDPALQQQLLFQLLFDPLDMVSYGRQTLFNSNLTNQMFDPQFNCIPPLAKIGEPPLMAINPGRPSAKGGLPQVNMLPRTFLFEIDDMALDAQFKFWIESGIPFTAINYTGNKSLHILVRLKEALSLEAYEGLHKAVVKCIEEKFKVFPDSATCKPNRTTKIPGFDGKVTTTALLAYSSYGTVDNEQFIEWAYSIGVTSTLVKGMQKTSIYRNSGSFKR